MDSPFVADTSTTSVDQWRKDFTINYLKNLNTDFGKSLDIGNQNPFSVRLKNELSLKSLSDTDFDLNYPKEMGEKFDTIFCFEVLEHIQNPLLFLDWCAEHLNKSGKLYLSTPVGGFPSKLMWPNSHFHEMDQYRIEVLFKLSKLNINKNKIIKAPSKAYLETGLIRPIFRILFGGWFFLTASQK